MYAVISDRTRQFTVRPGDELLCDLDQEHEQGQELTFDSVLVLGDEGNVRLGKPHIAGARVVAEVLGVVKGDKLFAFRFKRRKNVRKKRGHRQQYTRVRIREIQG